MLVPDWTTTVPPEPPPPPPPQFEQPIASPPIPLPARASIDAVASSVTAPRDWMSSTPPPAPAPPPRASPTLGARVFWVTNGSHLMPPPVAQQQLLLSGSVSF